MICDHFVVNHSTLQFLDKHDYISTIVDSYIFVLLLYLVVQQTLINDLNRYCLTKNIKALIYKRFLNLSSPPDSSPFDWYQPLFPTHTIALNWVN